MEYEERKYLKGTHDEKMLPAMQNKPVLDVFEEEMKLKLGSFIIENDGNEEL